MSFFVKTFKDYIKNITFEKISRQGNLLHYEDLIFFSFEYFICFLNTLIEISRTTRFKEQTISSHLFLLIYLFIYYFRQYAILNVLLYLYSIYLCLRYDVKIYILYRDQVRSVNFNELKKKNETKIKQLKREASK